MEAADRLALVRGRLEIMASESNEPATELLREVGIADELAIAAEVSTFLDRYFKLSRSMDDIMLIPDSTWIQGVLTGIMLERLRNEENRDSNL